VSIARSYVGTPYVWGGGSPTAGFDCSGFTQYVYAKLGVPLVHYAASQWHQGRRLTAAEVRPGDLVFFEPRFDGPGHVGIYVGHGLFIDAPHTGDVIRISSFADPKWAARYVGAVRPY
jgi:cell wall-associated NlpC family hydrolase